MGRDKGQARAPSSSSGAAGEQAAGAADGSLARSDCALCKKEVSVGSEDYITAHCKRCGALPLHPECVAEELERTIKATWTSARQTLATYTKRLQKRPWEVLGERARTGQRCFGCSEGTIHAVDLCKMRKVAVPLPPPVPAARPKKAAAKAPAAGAAAGGSSTSSAKQAAPPRQQGRQVVVQQQVWQAVQPQVRQEAAARAEGPTFAQLQAEEAAKAAAAQAAQEQRMRQQAAERRAKEEASKTAAAQAAQEERRRKQEAREREAAAPQAREAAERPGRWEQQPQQDNDEGEQVAIELLGNLLGVEREEAARLLQAARSSRSTAREDSGGAVPTPQQGAAKARPSPLTPSVSSGDPAEGAVVQQLGTEDSWPAGQQQAPAGEAAPGFGAAPAWSAGEWGQAPPQQLQLPPPLAHQQLHPMQPHSLRMLPPQQQPPHLFPPQLTPGPPLSPPAHQHGNAFRAGFEAGLAAILAQGGAQVPAAVTPQPSLPTWLQPGAAQAQGPAGGADQWAHTPGHLSPPVAPAALGQPFATAGGEEEVAELMAMMGI